MENFFTIYDNFEEIIAKNSKDINYVETIKTGWTNFVFKVKTNQKTYFFRFPRNDFFSNALLKEVKMIDFLKNKLSLQIPDMKVKLDNNRPFSLHEEIEGESLTSCFDRLTENEKYVLIKDICNLLKELSSLESPKHFQRVSNFLDNLSLVSGQNYDLSKHDFLKKLEGQNLVFSHGDFNPGNLILKNGKLVAVIDFSFSGLSSPLTDLSRICGRMPAHFSKPLIAYYGKLFKQKIEPYQIEILEKIWKYVEKKYIEYIRDYHKDIILPKELI